MIEDEYKLLLAQTILGQMCHGLKVNFRIFDHSEEKMVELVGDVLSFDIYHGYIVGISSGGIDYQVDMMKVKPYLRPLESMTDEEYAKFLDTQHWECGDGNQPKYEYTYKTFDWLNEHHFDYRGLIDKCLALEAPEGMYNFEK